MAEIFSQDYWLLWAAVLGVGLFFPVRQLIWILYVRRAEREGEIGEERRRALRRRAGVTAALLVFLFAALYSNHLFQGGP